MTRYVTIEPHRQRYTHVRCPRSGGPGSTAVSFENVSPARTTLRVRIIVSTMACKHNDLWRMVNPGTASRHRLTRGVTAKTPICSAGNHVRHTVTAHRKCHPARPPVTLHTHAIEV